MPLPDISLAQFNRIASGKYNAGLVDFKTDDQGQVTGLDKVNHHIHKTGKNTVELSPERIVEVKEAFIAALERGGVKPEDMTKIRKSLGLPEDLTDSLRTDARHEMMNRRFTPLTRQQVRGILDKFARQGRGFTMESQAEVSFDDAEAAAATSRMGSSRVQTRKSVNHANLAAAKGRYEHSVGDALSLLAGVRPLKDLARIMGNRFKGENAVNERQASTTALRNNFVGLFSQAIRLLNADETPEFTLFGLKAKLSKGPDGNVVATLSDGKITLKASLGRPPEEMLQHLIGRAADEVDTLGADNVKLLLDKVFEHDTESFLTGEDRTSLTRQFTAAILVDKLNVEDVEIKFDQLLNGNYNTGTLVEVANLALDGQVATKQDLDRLHAELARNNAGLDGEILELQSRPEGQELVDFPPPSYDEDDVPLDEDGNPVKVPAYVAKIIENGYSQGPVDTKGGPYQTKLRAAIDGAPDKPAEVRRILGLAIRHLDPVDDAETIGKFNKMADNFAVNWAAAQDDAARNALIDDFVGLHADAVRRFLGGTSGAYQRLYLEKYPAPATFAKVVMGSIFNGAGAAQDMMERNFTVKDVAKLGLDATSIATGELKLSKATLAGTLLPWYKGPNAKTLVMNKLVEDTNSMGGDKSYQIDIGV